MKRARWLAPVLILLGAAAGLGHLGADRLARAVAYEEEVAGLEPAGGDNELETERLRAITMLASACFCLALGGAITLRARGRSVKRSDQNL